MNNYLQTELVLDSIRLGWALIHFLWQGLVIALLLEIALAMAGRKNASLRYSLDGFALAVMPICLAVTYCLLGHAKVELGQSGSSGLIAAHMAISPMVLPTFPHTLRDLTLSKASAFELDRWMPLIVAAWLLGIVVLTGRKAGGFIVLHRLRQRGVSSPDKVLAELFHQACAKIGVDATRVCLKISTLVQVPMAMGWVRPIVLFPACLLSGLSPSEIELLLAHELAHIRRHDFLVNLLQTLIETLFFYHPVTWWISRRMRQERENCCDDLVTVCSTEVVTYAKVLFRLETMRVPGSNLASAANDGSLLQRIQRLVGEPSSSSGMGLSLVLAVIVILGVTAVFSVTKAQTNSPGALPATLSPAEVQSLGIPVFKGNDRVAAWVNGHPILEVTVEQQGAVTEKSLAQNYSGDELKQRITKAREIVLNALIARELIIESFKAAGEFIPKSYTDARIDDIIKSNYGGNHDDFLKTVAARGGSLEMYRKEIEDVAIFGYMRNKFVTSKISQYYRDHLDLFPQDEQLNVTMIEIRGDKPAVTDAKGNRPSPADAKADLASQVVRELRSGADVQGLARRYDDNEGDFSCKTLWVVKDGPVAIWPAWWPVTWENAEALRPSQTTDVTIGYGDYSKGGGPSHTYPYYYILKLNERRPATIAMTDETKLKREALIHSEQEKVQSTWLEDLRAKAKIQILMPE